MAFVEADQVVQALDHGEVTTGVDRVALPDRQHDVGTHLSIDRTDDVRVDAGVAIIDSGIDHTHPDLHVVAGSGKVVSHTYGGAGSYTVMLTAGDGTSTDTESGTVSCSKKGKNLVCG